MTGVAHTWALLEATTWNVVFLTLGLLTLPCLMLGTIMIIHDRMLAEREQEANTDFLTGLLSRKAWWLQAERYCAQALRTRRPLTLLLLDIDHFKRINDLHGHAVGDAVLRHFGLLAIATLRSSDHAGRVGGEEFAVMFPDSRGEAVMEVAGRLLESVRRTPCGHGGGAISYTSARAWPSGSRARTCNRCSSAPTALRVEGRRAQPHQRAGRRSRAGRARGDNAAMAAVRSRTRSARAWPSGSRREPAIAVRARRPQAVRVEGRRRNRISGPGVESRAGRARGDNGLSGTAWGRQSSKLSRERNPPQPPWRR